MPLVLVVLFLFVLCGWSLPSREWGAVPILIGASMILGGLMGIVASFRSPGHFGGFGSVVIAFFGAILCLVGLGMSGRADLADCVLNWFGSIPYSTLVPVCFVIGFVLAAFAKQRH